MTSVPSRRQPSSGSKLRALLPLLGLLLLLLSGCELFKPIETTSGSGRTDRPRPPREQPAERDDDRRTTGEGDNGNLDPIQSRRVYDPTTGTYIYVSNAPTEPMDTVRWRLQPEDRFRPIVEDGDNAYVPTDPTPGTPGATAGPTAITQVGTAANGSRLLSGYNVAVALPFLSDRYAAGSERVDPNSLWALHYNAGIQLALAELRSGSRTAYNVTVQDTKARPEATGQLINAAPFQSAQLVFGPYLKGNVTLMAEAARGQEKVLLSPYSAAAGVSAANPNYVQVNPTLETHLRNLIGHAYRTQGADRIVLVSGPDAAKRATLAYVQDEYKILTGNASVQPLEELIVETTSVDLRPYLTGRKTVFLVAEYSDESFVGNFLRQLYSITRGDYGDDLAVYGLPQWKDFERINFDYYEGTNVHISSSVYIDPLDPAVRAFRRSFYDEFQELPRDEAFVGYDMAKYFLRMAAEHGTRFQYELERNPEDVLHTKFRFQPVATVPATATSFENATLDRFENKYVNILRFRDYAFRRVN